MPGAVINLNRARKERARAERRARGDENSAKFGQAKAEKTLRAARAAQAEARLDAHRRDDQRDSEPDT